MFTIRAAKGNFLDSPKVLKAVGAARRKALSKAGAFVRTRARSSIRKRKRPAAPGSPPSSHTGLLRRFIFFGYDTASDSVVVGPAKLGGVAAEDAPEVLEHGGSESIFVGKGKARHKVKATYAARPFMAPALAAEAPNFPALWKDSIR